MKGFCPLASGSKGNSIFIGTAQTRILIDAGISVSMLEKRLAELDVSLETIQAVLITHEHIDHIKGLVQLAKHFSIPILTNAETAKCIMTALKIRPRFKIFTTGEAFSFGDLEVHPFGIPHDAVDPVGFTIKTAGIKLGFCADLGHVTSLIRKMLEGCNYLYVEANHEPSMVHACARPDVYKKRVLSRQGHLSNDECAQLLVSLLHEDLRSIHLAHLSSECNSEQVALQKIEAALASKNKKIAVSIAYQEILSRKVLF